VRGKPLRPTPKISLPWLIWSMVAASSATRSGWQSGNTFNRPCHFSSTPFSS